MVTLIYIIYVKYIYVHEFLLQKNENSFACLLWAIEKNYLKSSIDYFLKDRTTPSPLCIIQILLVPNLCMLLEQKVRDSYEPVMRQLCAAGDYHARRETTISLDS